MAALVWSSFANKAQAREMARLLLDEGLIACANLIDIDSVFCWHNTAEESAECGALFKTRADLLDRLVSRVETLHPYETPAVLGWQCDHAADATKTWLGALPIPLE